MKVFLSNFNKVINTKIRVPFPFLDVYIFKWNKCSHSGIHDHADKGCLMFLAKGEMEEYVYTNKLKYLYTNIHKAPTITFINNNFVNPTYDHVACKRDVGLIVDAPFATLFCKHLYTFNRSVTT